MVKKEVLHNVSSSPLCHCKGHVCLERDYCDVNGKRLFNGQVFNSQDCTQRCECEAPSISCVTLCPPEQIFCPPGHLIHYENKEVDGNCSCRVQKCRMADFCTNQGKKYGRGDKFVSSDCQSICECHGPGVECKTLCPPNAVVCNEDEEVQYVEENPVKDSTCGCKRAVCIKKIKATCNRNGQLYNHGDWLVDSHCLENCTCSHGNIECRTLCPPIQLKCGHTETLLYGREIIRETENCSCPFPICTKALKGSCDIEGEIVPFGKSTVSSDCLKKCTCHGSYHSCTSLCPPNEGECHDDKVPATIKEKSALAPRCECPVKACIDPGLMHGTCAYAGNVYKSGETFVSNNCAMNCTCDASNIFCKTLCPPMDVKCNAGQDRVAIRQKVTRSCFCEEYICVEKKQDFCQIDGKRYAYGEKFISLDCMNCKCLGPGIECTPLCSPLELNVCPLGTFMESVKELALNTTDCFCQRPVCVSANLCVANGNIYKPGETFIEPDCSSRCTCLGPDIACVTLCPPLSQKCPGGLRALTVYEEVSKSPSCSCLKASCSDVGTCRVDGKRYKVGDSFIDSKCTSNCTCKSSGYSCVSLCPPNDVTCSPTQQKIEIKEAVSDTQCSCKRHVCIEKDYCEYEGKTYKDGEVFVDNGCSSRCICRAPWTDCVSLCPPTRAVCAPIQREYFKRVKVNNKSKCSCPVPGCTNDGRKGLTLRSQLILALPLPRVFCDEQGQRGAVALFKTLAFYICI